MLTGRNRINTEGPAQLADCGLSAMVTSRTNGRNKYSTFQSKWQLGNILNFCTPDLPIISPYFTQIPNPVLEMPEDKKVTVTEPHISKAPLNLAAGSGCPQSTQNLGPELIPIGAFPFIQQQRDRDGQ